MNLMTAPEKASLRMHLIDSTRQSAAFKPLIEQIERTSDRDAEAVRALQRLRRAGAPVASVTDAWLVCSG